MPDTVAVNVKWAKSNFPVEIDPVRFRRRAPVVRAQRSFSEVSAEMTGWLDS
jgi:hypothetical protein